MCKNNVPAEAAMLSRLMILIDRVYAILSFSDGSAYWDDGCVWRNDCVWGVWWGMARDLAAEERWCCRERVFEWVAFKRCLNKCSRAFTKSGYSGEARRCSAVSELKWTFSAAEASGRIKNKTAPATENKQLLRGKSDIRKRFASDTRCRHVVAGESSAL